MIFRLIFITLLISSCASVGAQDSIKEVSSLNNEQGRLLTTPLIGMDFERLNQIKLKYQDPAAPTYPAIKKLFRDANSALLATPSSVSLKTKAPIGGTKNDFVSISPYLWPNPSTPGGLPFVYRDGETNPQNAKDFPDWENLIATNNNIQSLALAYFFTQDEKFAAKATELLKVWYLNSDTRMNPNLNFAHTWPGKESGNPTGIIVVQGIHGLLDSASLLKGSASFTLAVESAFKSWVNDFANWLNTSEFGKLERSGDSNHGTHCNGTIASMLYYVGNIEGAKVSVQEGKNRIAWQILPDGSMPAELDRADSLHYSIFNLTGYVVLARIGSLVGVDLWSYETDDGRSVRKALEYVAESALGLKPWPHNQKDKYDAFPKLSPILIQAYAIYKDPSYLKLLSMFPSDWLAEARTSLIYKSSQ